MTIDFAGATETKENRVTTPPARWFSCPKCHKKGVYRTTDRAGRKIDNCRYCLYSKSLEQLSVWGNKDIIVTK